MNREPSAGEDGAMDLYEILQVSPRAEIDVIRAAYRTLARRHHPDLGGDPRRMAAVNEAWAILGDPVRRRRYDATFRQAAAVAANAAAAAAAAAAAEASTRGGGIGVMNRAGDAAAAAERDVAERAAAARARERAGAATPPDSQPGQPQPPSNPGVLDFGRYAGSSVAELSRHDPDYLMWLERTPVGRSLKSEIQRVMELRRASASALPSQGRRPAVRHAGGWFR